MNTACVRTYHVVAFIAFGFAVAVLGLIVLASIGVVKHLELHGVSMWPHVIIGALIAISIGVWAVAKAKGLAGWQALVLALAWWLQ